MKPKLTYEFIDPETQLASVDFAFVESFLRLTRRTQVGWHYVIDLAWMYSRIKQWPKTFRVLDAGGGTGPLQFLLAEMGFDVTNIDLALSAPSAKFRERYDIRFRTLPSFRPTSYVDFLNDARLTGGRSQGLIRRMVDYARATTIVRTMRARQYSRRHDQWRRQADLSGQSVGKIEWIVGNLSEMPEIGTGTFDAVVSLSAWEHIPSEALEPALREIRRVIKPEAEWAVTTSGTDKSSTWWHDPSQSFCYSTEDLEKRFSAEPAYPQQPATILEHYRKCGYLQDNLPSFYKRSDKNGMPWGHWDPQYIPVGLGTQE
jgi:ubiquinone/menaquinone biosynthesis C-methylase UbiE